MNHYAISIITPTFNQGDFIEETINSVLDQNYPKLDYIIIDGGSSDKTIEIIKKYEKYLSYWITEKDGGQTHAINKGLKIAKGEIINWLNSDDYYNPETLFKVNEYFQGSSIKALLGRSRIFQDKGKQSKISKGGHIYSSIGRTIGDSLLDQPSAFFRKEIFDYLAPLDENLHYLMDRAMWIKYLLYFGLNDIKSVDNVFANFRLHERSKTVSETDGFNIERNSIFREIIDKFQIDSLKSLFDENISSKSLKLNWPTGPTTKVEFDKVIFEFMAVLVEEAYAGNDFKQAKQLIKLIDHSRIESESSQGLKQINKKLFLPKNILKWAKGRKN